MAKYGVCKCCKGKMKIVEPDAPMICVICYEDCEGKECITHQRNGSSTNG